MFSKHGEPRLPPNWTGRPNWYNDDTVANLELMRQLNPLPNGRTIGKFSEYELHVQDGPMFRECATPDWVRSRQGFSKDFLHPPAEHKMHAFIFCIERVPMEYSYVEK